MAPFISSWRCSTSSGRVIKFAYNWRGVELLSLSGVPCMGGSSLNGPWCQPYPLVMTVVGREAIAMGKLELSLLNQKGLPPTSHLSVRCHGCWSPGGNTYRGLAQHIKHCTGKESFHFLCHARTSGYITWILCDRVWGRNQYCWPLRSNNWPVSRSGYGKIYLQYTRCAGRLCILDWLFGERNP